MLHEPLVRAAANTPDDFTIRGREVSRVEGLSDGVFALAMTLLIVSGQVPTSFDELLNVFRGFPAFAACFAVLLWFWIVHYTFFRRFGLNDGTTIFLNSCLLFLVVFYVYPLKFVFTLFIAGLTGIGAQAAGKAIQYSQVDDLFIIYSTGFALVWLVFGLMYLHAYRLRDSLQLDPVERLLTRAEIGRCLAMISLALASILIATFGQGRAVAFAGWIYALTGPIEGVHGWSVGRRKARLLAQTTPTPEATQSSGLPTGTAHPPQG